MSTWFFEKCDTTENSLDELIKQMSWIMSKLDSKNVKRLDTNETSIKSANGETYINGPVLQMYDKQSPPKLRLQQGYDSGTSNFIFELYNKAGAKTVGIDSNGDATFTGDITASDISGGTIAIGSGDNIFKADSNGIYLGDSTFLDAPFRVEMDGNLTALDAAIKGDITGSSFNTKGDSDTNYIQIDDTGFKGYEFVTPDWELNGLVISSSGWADTDFYYRGNKYFTIYNEIPGVSLRNYDNLGNSYVIFSSYNDVTYLDGTWDFSGADSINGLVTDTESGHTHSVTVSGDPETVSTSSAGSHSHSVTN
jgi:hypothetical protein